MNNEEEKGSQLQERVSCCAGSPIRRWGDGGHVEMLGDHSIINQSGIVSCPFWHRSCVVIRNGWHSNTEHLAAYEHC